MYKPIEHYPSTKPYPFSDAVKAGGFVFLSGQVSMDDRGLPLYASVEEQTRTILCNIENVLARAECSLEDIVRVKVWLSDMKYFAAFNEVYRTFFQTHFPARSLTTTNIAFNLDVEIEVQALDRSHNGA